MLVRGTVEACESCSYALFRRTRDGNRCGIRLAPLVIAVPFVIAPL